MRVKRRTGPLLKIALVMGLLLALVLGGAVLYAGGVRALLRMDPPNVDYGALRSALSQALDAADRNLEGTRRAGNQAAAVALERAIRHSRANARRDGVQPIPPELREQFKDYFPAHILEKVRWAYPSRNLDLGSAVAAWYRSHGGAVTLQDTIIYSNADAAAHRYLWAHELTHVMQFEELGLKDFTRVYVTNPQMLERQAWENAREVVLAIQRDAKLKAQAEARAAAEAQRQRRGPRRRRARRTRRTRCWRRPKRRPLPISRKGRRNGFAAGSSVPCPSHCAAAHRRTARAWAV